MNKLRHWLLIYAILIAGGIGAYIIAHTPVEDSIVPQKVDSRWEHGPSDWGTSLDYMELHPVCRDALRRYVVTDPKVVAYMCNMVGDTWVTDLMQEE